MFDLRYHVASLAAVFLALAVGILLGIGVADRGLIDRGREGLLEARVGNLEQRLESANARFAGLEASERAAAAFAEEVYPLAAENRLDGRRVALVFVGSADSELQDAIEDVLAEAGAPPLLRVRALRVPLDEDALVSRYLGDVEDLGRELGEEFVEGGEAPLWERMSSVLVEERVGSMVGGADAVVVARPVEPQRGDTARFLRGFYAGLAGADAPAVGVDFFRDPLSPVDTFKRAGLSTIDHLETEAGRLSLAVVLAGGQEGNYGVGEAADDGVMPPLDPVVAPTE